MFALMLADTVAFLLASTFTAILAYGGWLNGAGNSVPYVLLAAVTCPLWPILLATSRGYDQRMFGVGGDEFRRVSVAGVRLFVTVAVLSYATKIGVGRTLLLVGTPSVVLLTASSRAVCRAWLVRKRRSGSAHYTHEVLIVGRAVEADLLIGAIAGNPEAGLRVSGVCLPTQWMTTTEVSGVPVLGNAVEAATVAAQCNVDTIIVCGDGALTSEELKALSWALEGSGVDLFLAPSVTEMASPRLTIRPLGDRVLLQIAAPAMRGPRRVAKSLFDRLFAVVLLVALSPALLIIALAVCLSTPGGPVYRQTRVGLNGALFTCWKFRSMRTDADSALPALRASSDSAGVLFKMHNDPRVTPVGRVLRRFSLDELPQLLNVVRGNMSLVGPRPPLPSEVALYAAQEHRRLLVEPGMTGLWQVSGRSDLPWDQAVRLDLHYVANWTPVLDLMIMCRTAKAVFAGRGAY